MRRLLTAVAVFGALALTTGSTALAAPPPSPGPGSANACNGLHVAETHVTNSTAFEHMVAADLALCHGI